MHHGLHPKIDYILLVLRNLFTAVAVLFFLGSLFPHDAHNIFKAIGYFAGAAAYILQNIEVKTFVMNGQEKSTQFFTKALDVIEEKGIEAVIAVPGDVFTVGALQLKIFGPQQYLVEDDEWNEASLIIHAQYGNRSFLLTGDAEKISESEMIKKYAASEFKADLMKAGHHGSNTSNSEALLRAADPEWIVVSCGEGNKYGHPHAEFLTRAESLGITVYRTDLEGTIVFVSDGKVIKKSDS